MRVCRYTINFNAFLQYIRLGLKFNPGGWVVLDANKKRETVICGYTLNLQTVHDIRMANFTLFMAVSNIKYVCASFLWHQ